MKKKLNVFIVIVNYKTYPDLNKCLYAIKKQERAEKYTINIVIVDSEYKNAEVKKIKREYPQVHFILQNESYGVATNYNNGFKKALSFGADFIFMITPDVFLEKDVLRTLMKHMEVNENLGAVTCKTLLPSKPPTLYFVGGKLDPVAFTAGHIGALEKDIGQFDDIQSTDFLNCALVLIRAEVFNKVGFFESLYFWGYEDIDFTVRIKKAGFDIEVVTKVYAVHAESGTVEKKSMQRHYYFARNHLLFIKRNANLRQKMIAYLFVIKKSVELIPQLIHGDRNVAYYTLLGRKDFLFGKLGYRKIEE